MYKIVMVLKDCFVDEITCDDYIIDLKDKYIATISKHNMIRKFYFEFVKQAFVIDYKVGHVHEVKL